MKERLFKFLSKLGQVWTVLNKEELSIFHVSPPEFRTKL